MCGWTMLHHSVFIVCISLAWKVLMIHPHFLLNFVTYCLYMVSETECHSFWYQDLWHIGFVQFFCCLVQSMRSWFLPYRSSSNLFSLNCMLFICCHLYIVLRSFCSLLKSSSFLMAKKDSCITHKGWDMAICIVIYVPY